MNVIRVGDAKFVPQVLPVTDPLYQPHSLLYYQHYYLHSHVDLSFAVVLGGQVYAMVWLTKYQQRFDYYGLPMLFWLDSRADDKARQGAFKVACKELTKLRQQHDITQMYYQQPAGVLDPFSEYLLQQGFTPQLQVTQSVDLTQSEDLLWAQLRDVYHSNIRFGQQHLRYQLLQRDELSVPGLEWRPPHDFSGEPHVLSRPTDRPDPPGPAGTAVGPHHPGRLARPGLHPQLRGLPHAGLPPCTPHGAAAQGVQGRPAGAPRLAQ